MAKKRMFKVKEPQIQRPLRGAAACPKCKAKIGIHQSHYNLQPTIQCAMCGLFHSVGGHLASIHSQLARNQPPGA